MTKVVKFEDWAMASYCLASNPYAKMRTAKIHLTVNNRITLCGLLVQSITNDNYAAVICKRCKKTNHTHHAIKGWQKESEQ